MPADPAAAPTSKEQPMRILVTGSSGHLGEALVRRLRELDHEPVGLDIVPAPSTSRIGSIANRAVVRSAMAGAEAVLHGATLHKPHVATHSRQDFVDTNVTGTLNLLEEAAASSVKAFIFTSTTSVFGDALIPPSGAPAAWVMEDVVPIPKNIYGATKAAAEDLCQLFHRNAKLPCLVLRTSRFFPEEDDEEAVRKAYADDNLKLNELLARRVDIEDVVEAHMLAMARAPQLGFRKYIISATTPFCPEDLAELRGAAPKVLLKRVPAYEGEYAKRGWSMFPSIDRVYVNARAREELGWRPRHDFAAVLERLRAGGDIRSPLAKLIGAKGYHPEAFGRGPYPVA